MSLLAAMGAADGRGDQRVYGVVVGIVTNNQDPDRLGRVKVKFPWLGDDDESAWARIASPMAGKNRGVFLLPEVDDEVLVVFEHGDMRFPYVLGALWNGSDAPPETNADGKNAVRVIRSRSGHVIRLTDADGGEKIEIIDKTGDNRVVIESASNTITVSAPNGTIKLAAQQIDIEATGVATLKGATVNIN
jgi:uncharacterized protein involved in type VI secretion and phage assembly